MREGEIKTNNLIITGVGGQGNVLAARLLGETAISEGYDVSIGDIFGLSQRGGSVASHVRWTTKGKCIAPIVPRFSLNILIGLEPLDALRILTKYGSPKTVAIVNEKPIVPIGVQAGRFSYPDTDELLDGIKGLTKTLLVVDASTLAIKLGNIKVVNMIMLGALAGSSFSMLHKDSFIKVIEERFSGEILEINLRAFQEGYKLVIDMVNQ